MAINFKSSINLSKSLSNANKQHSKNSQKDHEQPKHQLTSNVKLLQKVALIYDNKVLVVKRDPQSLSRPEAWDLPGGNSEWPEESQAGYGQFSQDAVREVFEETGILIPEELFEAQNIVWFNTYFDVKKQVFSVMIGWAINISEANEMISKRELPKVTLSDEHTDYRWIETDQTNSFDFGGKRGSFIQEIITMALQNRK